MLTLLIFAGQEDAKVLGQYFDVIGYSLCAATAHAFDDTKGNPMGVSAMVIPYIAGSTSAPRVQILGIASHSREREGQLGNWQNLLAKTWETVFEDEDLRPIRDHFSFPPGGKPTVEVTTIMPKGNSEALPISPHALVS